ncbi:hypothetical protein IGB42_04074 [Andreprevotia sp. IGB-42]|uniref:DoxX family protein n=1 Tax=Andreprevotia sp. IGB-42 TaxID=2497473 RepID=UPI00157EE49E|nr:hypothetical protein [Andreprevotia sp. IGB-42]KAF0811456.1 hypothetical protein IGB42_04074 [Andreprevotia sp. IGB-42]
MLINATQHSQPPHSVPEVDQLVTQHSQPAHKVYPYGLASSGSRLRHIALGIVFAWFLVGGIAHFLLPHTFAQIVPPAVPWPLAAVYISGLLELIGAAALIPARSRRWAGWGLMLLTIAVTPANVYMWQHAERFPEVAPWLLLLRLPLQLVLLLAIVVGTQTRK